MGSVSRQNRFNEIVQNLRDLSDEIKEHDIENVEIQQNEHGIEMGTYSRSEIADMIYFLADMMEVL